MYKLKPCPFCGGVAEADMAGRDFIYLDEHGRPRDIGIYFTVKCVNNRCGCTVGSCENLSEAIARWNKRADMREETNGES